MFEWWKSCSCVNFSPLLMGWSNTISNSRVCVYDVDVCVRCEVSCCWFSSGTTHADSTRECQQWRNSYHAPPCDLLPTIFDRHQSLGLKWRPHMGLPVGGHHFDWALRWDGHWVFLLNADIHQYKYTDSHNTLDALAFEHRHTHICARTQIHTRSNLQWVALSPSLTLIQLPPNQLKCTKRKQAAWIESIEHSIEHTEYQVTMCVCISVPSVCIGSLRGR